MTNTTAVPDLAALPELPKAAYPGTSANIPNAIPDLFRPDQMTAYGQACIAHYIATQPAPSGDAVEVLREALIAIDDQLVAILNGADGSYYNKLKDARNALVRIWHPMPTTSRAATVAKDGGEAGDYKQMFEDAVQSLAAIDAALGIDPDECGGSEPILQAIADLRAERDQWVDANYADDGKCQSCVNDKCVTGSQCVAYERDFATPKPEASAANQQAGEVPTKTIEMKPWRTQKWLTADLLHRAPSAEFVKVRGNDGAQLEHPAGGPLTWVRCPSTDAIGVVRVDDKWHWLIAAPISEDTVGMPDMSDDMLTPDQMRRNVQERMAERANNASQEDDPQLYACDFLLNAAQEFWSSCRQVGQYGAVQWLSGTDGALLIYTRGEYREQLMSNIHMLPNQKERVIAPAAPAACNGDVLPPLPESAYILPHRQLPVYSAEQMRAYVLADRAIASTHTTTGGENE